MRDDVKNSNLSDHGATAENEKRLELLCEIGRILASTEKVRASVPPILETICRSLQFDIGELWVLDEAETGLKLKSCWHFKSDSLARFADESRTIEFSIGEGLPGKVWRRNAPVWIEKLNAENNLPRLPIAQRAGLQSAFAFPVLLGEKFLGAFCFFCQNQCPHDEKLLEMFIAVGGSVGQLIERERVENSLRESEERYRAFIEQSTEGIWRYELDERIAVNLPIEEQIERAFHFGYLAECNDAMARMYGLKKAEDLVGARLSDLFDMTDAKNVEYLRAFIESGYNLTDAESHEKDVNGDDKYFLNSLVGTVENGNLIRVWGTQRDITEQKRDEEKLRESDAVLQTINQSSPTLIYLKDRAGRMLNANPATLEVVGKTLFEVLGKTHSEYMQDEAEGAAIAGNDRRIIEGGATETFEEIVLTKNVPHTFLSTKTPYRNERGEIIGLVGVSFDITERKIAEKNLRDSEERFRNMADNAPVMIWVTDATGCCKYLSQSWYDFTGQTPETGLGFGWLDATHPDDWKRAEEAFLTANERRATFRIEYRLRGANDDYIWAIDSAQPRFDKDGEFLGYIGSVIDITERKAAEESLRESEQRYRSLFESMDEGFCLCEILLDADGKPFDYRFLEVNPVFEAMTGLQNAAGKTALELLPNLESHWFEIYGKVALTGEAIRFTDGSETMNRWFDVYASRVGGTDSRKFALLFTNITERKRAELALQESQAHLALALKVGRAGTFEWDIKNNVNRWSPEIEAMYGVAVGTFEGDFEAWKKRLVAEDSEQVEREIQNALAAKATDLEYEFRVILPDDSRRWFAGRARFDYDENGEPLMMIGINVDVTGRKEAEFERELLFVEAQKAREIAERANHSKDEFIALVSHELRSPLNAMLGWTRILQKKQADEKTTEYALDVIVRNARSQSRLIEDLLDIARIGEGKLRIEMRATAIIPIIKTAIEIIKPAADGKNISIAESLDQAANFIHGDDDRLRQIIENLLSNAVKFTPEGGEIEIGLRRSEKQAQLIVSDTGQGIPADFLPEIFEKFRQADPSTTRRHGGLGIGLSLARDLVELHGGTISAQSEGEGTGATFIVTLPLRTVMPIKQNSDTEGAMSSQGKLNGFWILAVDDEADAREIVSFMLQINGAKVTTANSAVEALEILKGANGRIPDILLSDISMPFESGYALLEKIRALPREHGGEIPAVALTAFNRPEDREAAFEAGFQKHLGKPVDMDALIDAIVETAGAKPM